MHGSSRSSATLTFLILLQKIPWFSPFSFNKVTLFLLCMNIFCFSLAMRPVYCNLVLCIMSITIIVCSDFEHGDKYYPCLFIFTNWGIRYSSHGFKSSGGGFNLNDI